MYKEKVNIISRMNPLTDCFLCTLCCLQNIIKVITKNYLLRLFDNSTKFFNVLIIYNILKMNTLGRQMNNLMKISSRLCFYHNFEKNFQLPYVFLGNKVNGVYRSYSTPAFTTLSVSVPKEFVYHVQLNRPDKRNAINNDMWK